MTQPRFQDLDYPLGGHGDILRMIRSGAATSRSALARAAGLAPSTASTRVDNLLRLGLVREAGADESRGGRRARLLELDPAAGVVVAFDIGASHTDFAVADLNGKVLAGERSTEKLSLDPTEAVGLLWRKLVETAAGIGLGTEAVRGITIGVPAPVTYPEGRLVLPSFMPSWNNVSLPDLFAGHTDVPVLVENDANLLALAEAGQPRLGAGRQLLTIKLGTRIGCGIVSDGRLHRGVNGAAGEISHTTVNGESSTPCICGVSNCLESVASGGAIVARLRKMGYSTERAADVVELGETGDPAVVDVLRESGSHIGRVLSSIVNFFNPKEVVLGGAMSTSAPLVAAIRAELFQQCLPLVTSDLEVRAARQASDMGLRGGVNLVLDEVLAPARIELLVRESLEGAA